ncbi:MAG: AAA family ATPase [Candidatus Delongbacteria bacterium]|nr:AAA family ATPase [Candidatus Delongbacteria bacterium]
MTLPLADSLLGSELESLGRILNPVARGEERLREGENRWVAILFMDLKGFTELGERLHSEDVQQILDRVLTVFTNSIEKYSGYIDKYEGDLIMALFGSRNASEQDTERALLAGLKMLRDLPEVNRLLGTSLSIRIGVNTGLVTTGRVGKKREGDFTVYGDAVNVASRMESHAPLNSILIPEETRALVANRFRFTDRGELQVKGKAQPLHVWTVDHALESTPLPLGSESEQDFIGREPQLQALAMAWDEACAGHANGTLVARELLAPAGQGKSRLVREFLGRLTQESSHLVPVPLRVAPGTTGGTAGSLWRSLLTQLLPLGDADQDESCRALLRQTLASMGSDSSDSGDDVMQRANLLGLLLGLPWPSGQPPMDPGGLPARLAICLRHLLEQLASRSPQPLTLICEDLDRADALSHTLLEHLASNWNRDRDREQARGGLFLLLLHRGEGIGNPGALPGVDNLRLPPLNDEESRRLLLHALDCQRLPEGLSALLLPRAQGNPLVLRELLVLLQERDLLVRREGAWLLRDESRRLPLPHGLNQLLLSRVDLLPASLKRGLQCAAVLGGQFPRELLLDCLARLADATEGHDPLQELLRGGWLRELEHGELCVVSSLVEEVCYTTLLRHNRRLIHGLAAREAAKRWPDDPARTLLIARHFDEADLAPEAGHWLARAWREGACNTDPRLRLDLGTRLARRLEAAPGISTEPALTSLQRELAALQEGLGQWGEALERCQRLIAGDHGPLPPGARSEVLVLQGRLQALQGRREEAGASLEEALVLAEATGTAREQALALSELARLARIRGHLPRAIALYEDALLRLPLQESPAQRADCLMGLGSCRRAIGDSPGSREALEAAQRLFSQLDDLRGLCGCQQSLGDLARLGGDLAGARQHYQQALQHSRALGLREKEAAVRRSLGDLLLLDGQLESAEQELADALALFGELGDLHGRAVVLRSQGHLALQLGDATRASDCFLKSRDLRRVLGDAKGEAFALTDLARLAASEGRLEAAEAFTQEALELFRVQGQRPAVTQCLCGLAELRLQRGERARARAAWTEALALLEGQPDSRAMAVCVLGLAECEEGPLPPALRERLEDALPRLVESKLDSAARRARELLDGPPR